MVRDRYAAKCARNGQIWGIDMREESPAPRGLNGAPYTPLVELFYLCQSPSKSHSDAMFTFCFIRTLAKGEYRIHVR